MAYSIIALFALSAFGIVWYFVGGVKIKSGWQNGSSPLARFLDRRRRAKFDLQLPEALSTMSNALRAGFSLNQAFRSVIDFGENPISEEFKILEKQLAIGMSFDDALESMAKRVGSDDLTLVTTAITIARKTGGNVTEIFDNIGKTIRDRMKVERKVLTLTAQGRLQGLIVTMMPLILGVGMTLLKPKMMIPFLCSGLGVVTILFTLSFMIVGWLVIRKIIRIDV